MQRFNILMSQHTMKFLCNLFLDKRYFLAKYLGDTDDKYRGMCQFVL